MKIEDTHTTKTKYLELSFNSMKSNLVIYMHCEKNV
jgi:hypothetical protein